MGFCYRAGGRDAGNNLIISHSRTEAFDSEDLHLMQILANFAAMGIRQQRQQTKLVTQARASAAIEMAHDLAHQINNPLQSLTNNLFLAKHGRDSDRALALKPGGGLRAAFGAGEEAFGVAEADEGRVSAMADLGGSG